MDSYGGAHELDPTIFGEGGAGEKDGWSGFHGDFGDYYREPDDVYRGVTMAQDVPDAFGSSSIQGFADGDFYRDSDDIYKGLSMGAVPEAQLFDGPPMPGGLQKLEPGFGGLEGIGQFCGAVEPFTEADVPPPAPSGPFVKLEGTTIFVSASSPSDIGNSLLNFLSKQLAATVTKVNRKKFAIKAEAFSGNAMCTLKIRVYQQEQGRYAVEVQQRSGDRFAFGRVFQEASECLGKRFAADALTKPGMELTAMPPPPPASDVDGLCAQAEAGPLLDLAGGVERADLQAEAAAALAEMAQDSQAAAALCTAPAFQEFKALVQSEKPEVAYPTARLLSSISLCPEAKQCFADGELLSAIVGKVHSDALSLPVQKLFAQVLASAVPCCAQALPKNATEEVSAALVQAMTSAVVAESVRRTLQQVHLTLKCQSPGIPA